MSKSKQFRRSQRKQRQHKGGDASQYVSSVVGGIGQQTAVPGTNVIAMRDLNTPPVIETKGGALVALTPATIETPIAPVKGGAAVPLTSTPLTGGGAVPLTSTPLTGGGAVPLTSTPLTGGGVLQEVAVPAVLLMANSAFKRRKSFSNRIFKRRSSSRRRRFSNKRRR
jgi:hypothetical protein